MLVPVFVLTPTIVRALMDIEASRQAVIELSIDPKMVAGLRYSAQLAATHYSTQIEGNRLTQAQVEEALGGAHFPGRERDEIEVRNYYRALEYIARIATKHSRLTEMDFRRIHGCVITGKATATPYRDGQNVIRNSATGSVVYMPPEAQDVPSLMHDLLTWINDELKKGELPVPVIAGIAHYEYATIHPYYDGNGRTARLITMLILQRAGYGLHGIYSLEEQYARNLGAYYAALTVGNSHNYYLGRATADISGFIDYFCTNMADVFSAIRAQATQAVKNVREPRGLLRGLDPQQRNVLEILGNRGSVTTGELADYLNLSTRTVAALCRSWIQKGFLELADSSRKKRSYRLGEVYEQFVVKSVP